MHRHSNTQNRPVQMSQVRHRWVPFNPNAPNPKTHIRNCFLVIWFEFVGVLNCTVLFPLGRQKTFWSSNYAGVTVCSLFPVGAGFGAYQAVDFALVMDVLPVEKDKAKDLAVWHQVLYNTRHYAPVRASLVGGGFEVKCATLQTGPHLYQPQQRQSRLKSNRTNAMMHLCRHL